MSNKVYIRFKRLMDIITAVILIIITLPIILLLYVFNYLAFGSPVFFKQQRAGLYGQAFLMYKFRTMTNQKDAEGNLLPDHQRLTAFGRFLRSTSLDELPSLFNVIKGDMSIVGPRPLLVKYIPYYTQYEQKRHSVRPGITGLAQVSGRNLVDWKSRLAMDVKYVKNISLTLDLRILLKTFTTIWKRNEVVLHALDDFDVHRRKQYERY